MNHKTWNIKDHPQFALRGENGRYFTEGLFYEYGNPDAPYTLKTEDFERDGNFYVSMYKVYMTCADEYEAAERLLGSQAHWKKLLTSKFFLKGHPRFNMMYGLEKWREDMRNRDLSLSKRILIERVEEDKNVNAAKALQEWDKKSAPSKKQGKVDEKVEGEDDLFAGFDKVSGRDDNVKQH